MAITVKLQDETVRVGGDFQAALSVVKSFRGARFDPATKVWSIPAGIKEFRQRCGLPLDLASGAHVTRWGTRYGAGEWAAKQASARITIPAEIMQQVDAAEQRAEQDLLGTLSSFGISDQAVIAKLRRLYSDFVGDLGEAETCGKIRFSNPTRRAALEAALEAYDEDWLKAQEIAEDYRAAEQRRIEEEYGV